jgi:hypothetical protein
VLEIHSLQPLRVRDVLCKVNISAECMQYVSIFHSVLQQLILVQNDIVRWYVFDMGTLLIILRTKEFFSLYDVGSTYLCWHDSVSLLNYLR